MFSASYDFSGGIKVSKKLLDKASLTFDDWMFIINRWWVVWKCRTYSQLYIIFYVPCQTRGGGEGLCGDAEVVPQDVQRRSHLRPVQMLLPRHQHRPAPLRHGLQVYSRGIEFHICYFLFQDSWPWQFWHNWVCGAYACLGTCGSKQVGLELVSRLWKSW